MNGLLKNRISIRPAVESDRRFVYEVFESVCDPAICGLDEPLRSQLITMQFGGQCQDYSSKYPNAIDQIIEFDKTRIGRVYTDDSAGRIHIVDIAILPHWRGQGIGTAVLKSIFEVAQQSSKPVSLRVKKENRAVGLYKKLGFKVTGNDSLYVEMSLPPQQAV